MRRSIRDRRTRRRIKKDFELQLTSMMDMLIILIVFLLKSYASNATAFATSSNIKLPTSAAEEAPTDSVNLIIDPTNISIDGEKIIEFKVTPGAEVKAETATYELESRMFGDSGRRILPLYDALVRQREKTELLMSKAVWKDKDGNPTKPKFQGALVIQADKAVRYDLLRKIMYTAGAAQFKVFKLVTVRKET